MSKELKQKSNNKAMDTLQKDLELNKKEKKKTTKELNKLKKENYKNDETNKKSIRWIVACSWFI